MIKLSDTQTILLSSAAQRENGSLLPLPTSVKPGGGAAKAMAAVVTRGFAEERETSDQAALCRTEGENRFGLFVTAAGAAAIGISLISADDQAGAADAPAANSKPPRKTAVVLDLLGRPDGATLTELIAVTGWLPHTTRAALTRLRKKGHQIARGKRDGVTCYSVATK